MLHELARCFGLKLMSLKAIILAIYSKMRELGERHIMHLHSGSMNVLTVLLHTAYLHQLLLFY